MAASPTPTASGWPPPARYVVDYGADARFWLALLVVGYGTALIVRELRKLRVVLARSSDAPPPAPAEATDSVLRESALDPTATQSPIGSAGAARLRDDP